MKLTIDKKLENYLIDFGLTREEIMIYLSLLQSGRNSVLELSKKTGLKRSTTHNYVDNLISRGIVSQTNYGGRRLVVAEVPEKLHTILDQRKWEIQRLENQLPDVVKGLYDSIPEAKENSEVQVKYYEGKKLVNLIYEEALKSNDFRAYVTTEELGKIFPENVEKFINVHKKRKSMTIREIMDDTEMSRKYAKIMPKERYYYRFVPKGMNIKVIDYMLFDNKVAIVNLENDTSGVIIYNKSYYENARAIFDFLWNMLPEIIV